MTEIRELPSLGLEKRELQKKEDELTTKVHELSGKILEVERKEKEKIERAMRHGTRISNSHNDVDRYSFTRAIRVALGIDKGGVEEEMNQEARREMSNLGQYLRGFGVPTMVLNRASSGQNFTTDGDGGYLVGPGGMKFYEAAQPFNNKEIRSDVFNRVAGKSTSRWWGNLQRCMGQRGRRNLENKSFFCRSRNFKAQALRGHRRHIP